MAKLQSLLARLKTREGLGSHGKDRLGPFPLSPGQKRIWALEQITPGLAVYNMPVGYRIEGDLDLDALHRAIERLVSRHEALRTTFHGDTEPVQIVHEEPSFGFTVVDLTASPSRLEEMGKQAVAKPFDIARGPLLRVTVFRLAASQAVLVINIHHIISDGWSHGIMTSELTRLYAGATLAPVELHSNDHTVFSETRDDSASLTFWKERLAGELPVAELPFDRPRPATASGRGGVHHFGLDAQTTEGLKRLARSSRASLFMTLLSAFDVLLYRVTGQTDCLVGTPVAGRGEPGTEGIFGYFANTLVMRTALDPGMTFAELLQKNRAIAMDAFDHADVPFERVVEAVQPDRHGSHHPIFQVMLTLQNEPLPPLRLAGTTVTWNQFHTATTKFDLWLGLEEENGALQGHFEYDTDLFDAATIARLVELFRTLLAGITTAPETTIAALPLLPAAERRLLVETFNATERDYGGYPTLMDKFEAQVARTPDRIALRFEGATLTYAELNAQANRVAHALIASGVATDDLVGVSIERSFEMMIAVYGALKCGAAYVPLDPSYPAERLAYMIADCGAKAILTKETLRLSENTENPSRRAGLRAYMIYTSGSTGKPKGAIVHHDGIANRLLWMQEYFGLTPDDVVLQKTPFSFDVSVWELFWPLQIGATLVIARPDGHQDPTYLAETIRTEGVTTLHFVPTMLRVFLEEGADGSSLRHIVCSGEELPVQTVEMSLARIPTAQIVNLYGPTECAVDVSVHRCTSQDVAARRIPIGVPIANTQLFVLDARLTPCPLGVAGELHIGGVQVGLGYLGRRELTAERFIANPFGPGRLYKTGDRARVCADGKIEFLGRLDTQVKVNGLRIEIGEIENVMRRHRCVSQALVTVHGDESGKKLVAYVVAGEAGLSTESVESWAGVFDENYAGSADAGSVFDIVGWNSSFTGEPIPAEEMRLWVDETVEKILECAPRTVLEIGCGTGLLLHRVAPKVDRYLGTDISPVAIRNLRASLPANCEVVVAPAHELPEGQFDLVVLNSVVQYFPSLTYFRSVIEEAAKRLAPGGKIFIGDVRDYRLLDAFHAAVRAHRGVVAEENELTLDPEVFARIAKQPPFKRATLAPKRGGYVNELSEYRYDATLHTDAILTGREITTDTSRRWEALSNQPARADIVGGLREYLRTQLPEFMVPSAFVVLPEFPLSPSGKIARDRLPAPHAVIIEDTEPRDAIERALAETWAEVLALPRVGIFANFFELGGDSIKTIQIAARAKKRGLELKSRQIFEHQTVAELARHVSTKMTAFTETAPFALADPTGLAYDDMEDAYPVSPFQHHELLELLDAPPVGLYAMRAIFPMPNLDPRRFTRAWNKVQSRHAALRTTFHWEDVTTPLQIVHRHVDREIETIDLSALSKAEIDARLDAFMDEYRTTPFHPDQYPQHRMTLFKTAADRYEFFLGFNYMLHDGWSTFALLDELFRYYDDDALDLPVPKQFRDHIAYLAKQDHAAAEKFWADYLHDFTEPTPLIANVTADPTLDFGKEVARYEKDFTARLDAFCRRTKVTLSSLFFGAWATLLGRYSGEDEVLFGTVVSGRPEGLDGVESIVGHFNNLVPIRVKIAPDKSRLRWLEDLQKDHVRLRGYDYLSPVKIRAAAGKGPREMLYESHVVFENFPVSDGVKSRFAGKDASNSRGAAQLDTPLRLELWPGDELLVVMSYYGNAFSTASILELQRELRQTLESLMESK